tara:strand:+ start:56 stop:541 length:486 start_codon:yes stop_codon:yes gene_type:complete
MSNLKILRLNSLDSQTVSLSTDKSSFTFNLDQNLINMGRCLVEVLSGVVQITADDDKNSKVCDADIAVIVLRSNISQEGISSETGGNGTILGQVVEVENKTSASLAQTAPLTFICNQLPSQILLERMNYTAANPSLLEPANTYTTRPLLFSVDLKLTFIDD